MRIYINRERKREKEMQKGGRERRNEKDRRNWRQKERKKKIYRKTQSKLDGEREKGKEKK